MNYPVDCAWCEKKFEATDELDFKEDVEMEATCPHCSREQLIHYVVRLNFASRKTKEER